MDAAAAEVGYEVDRVPYRSPEPVELGHDQLVASAHVVEGLVELRSSGQLPARPIDEDALAAGFTQRVELGVRVLITGRHPCVADLRNGPGFCRIKGLGARAETLFLDTGSATCHSGRSTWPTGLSQKRPFFGQRTSPTEGDNCLMDTAREAVVNWLCRPREKVRWEKRFDTTSTAAQLVRAKGQHR